MTLAHILYIPGILFVGVVFGFIFGSRSERLNLESDKRRDLRAQKRALREQMKKESS